MLTSMLGEREESYVQPEIWSDLIYANIHPCRVMHTCILIKGRFNLLSLTRLHTKLLSVWERNGIKCWCYSYSHSAADKHIHPFSSPYPYKPLSDRMQNMWKVRSVNCSLMLVFLLFWITLQFSFVPAALSWKKSLCFSLHFWVHMCTQV